MGADGLYTSTEEDMKATATACAVLLGSLCLSEFWGTVLPRVMFSVGVGARQPQLAHKRGGLLGPLQMDRSRWVQ